MCVEVYVGTVWLCAGSVHDAISRGAACNTLLATNPRLFLIYIHHIFRAAIRDVAAEIEPLEIGASKPLLSGDIMSVENLNLLHLQQVMECVIFEGDDDLQFLMPVLIIRNSYYTCLQSHSPDFLYIPRARLLSSKPLGWFR
eukprot:Gregarina_sp_Poly_1__7082@NODE_386_length_9004_cov_34_917534_g315_i0_p8_GENE_NODE_386_length_9004_cov_34_917534_g315_i0NODE_386_length_9004_cov_34_917534_g315_i0_p8_ORF_typecomplete_len142_score13_86_NODE_386_length_9004_cov_34_917534_g315_i025302955